VHGQLGSAGHSIAAVSRASRHPHFVWHWADEPGCPHSGKVLEGKQTYSRSCNQTCYRAGVVQFQPPNDYNPNKVTPYSKWASTMTNKSRKFWSTLALWFTIVALIFILLYQQHGPHRKKSSSLMLSAFIPASLVTFDKKKPVRSSALPL
jgi:hypothetical protein